jgi:hypothetical protein
MLKIWDTIAGRLYTSSVLQSFLLSLSWSTRCTCIYMPPYMTSRLLNARQLREDFKVQGHCSCRCTLRSLVAGIADHRPYPLPVQWLPLRHLGPLYGLGPQQLDTPVIRSSLCSALMPQAHLSVPRTCVLCLPSARLLLGAAIGFPVLHHTILQLCEVGRGYPCRIRSCFWSFRNVGSDRTSAQSLVPILARSLSCLLGAECLGDVFVL